MRHFGPQAQNPIILLLYNLKNSFVSAATFLVLVGTAFLCCAPVKNIVLVLGAFVDGSGWKPVYDLLVKAPITSTNANYLK